MSLSSLLRSKKLPRMWVTNYYGSNTPILSSSQPTTPKFSAWKIDVKIDEQSSTAYKVNNRSNVRYISSTIHFIHAVENKMKIINERANYDL